MQISNHKFDLSRRTNIFVSQKLLRRTTEIFSHLIFSIENLEKKKRNFFYQNKKKATTFSPGRFNFTLKRLTLSVENCNTTQARKTPPEGSFQSE